MLTLTAKEVKQTSTWQATIVRATNTHNFIKALESSIERAAMKGLFKVSRTLFANTTDKSLVSKALKQKGFKYCYRLMRGDHVYVLTVSWE